MAHIWNQSLRQMWRQSWKAKAIILFFAIWVVASIPTVPLGSFVGYHLVRYFQNPQLRPNPTEELTTKMFRQVNLGTLGSKNVLATVNKIRDSLFKVEHEFDERLFAENIPEGLDSVVFRTYSVPTLGQGVILADFLLSCGCDKDAGKFRLLEVSIFPDTQEYDIITDIIMPWTYYLNPWIDFLDPLKAMGTPET